MRGRDFLAIVDLLTPVETEASVRSRIGRLYYAAYLEARAWCEEHLGYQRTRFGREHADVQRMLVTLDTDIADNLRFLRTYRNTADYDLHVALDTLFGQMADALDRVSIVIARLDNLVTVETDPEESAPSAEPES